MAFHIVIAGGNQGHNSIQMIRSYFPAHERVILSFR